MAANQIAECRRCTAVLNYFLNFCDTGGIMDIRYIVASFAVLLCVTLVIADHEPMIEEDEFLLISGCVGKSADQPLCDELLKCFELLAQPLKDFYQQCLQFNPEGTGRCTKDKELFKSEEHRRLMYRCVTYRRLKEPTEEQEYQMDKFRICFRRGATDFRVQRRFRGKCTRILENPHFEKIFPFVQIKGNHFLLLFRKNGRYPVHCCKFCSSRMCRDLEKRSYRKKLV
ncbi:hypothetical protein NPIL_622401 [Nephila pilipes]|uniref:Uncharacterized protein n=1 Tax=Nephila pilipes TaxID=299642 RepID=A0A8X6TXT4_NEPPI|nr:hypothetical protein NPIL_622401 [Nephila pilipes]